jgi:hypothetical protein
MVSWVKLQGFLMEKHKGSSGYLGIAPRKHFVVELDIWIALRIWPTLGWALYTRGCNERAYYHASRIMNALSCKHVGVVHHDA